MAQRKPRIEYYWRDGKHEGLFVPVVNVRIVAANGEVVGQITQGFRDKTDARRAVNALAEALGIPVEAVGGQWVQNSTALREVGPGRKPS